MQASFVALQPQWCWCYSLAAAAAPARYLSAVSTAVPHLVLHVQVALGIADELDVRRVNGGINALQGGHGKTMQSVR
jgi:hypothetical protein